MIKKHLIALGRNFGFTFGGLWLFLESSSGFGWITINNFGFWGYVSMSVISLLLTALITYIEFYFRGKDEKITKIIDLAFPEIKDFKGSYRDTDWANIINSAEKEIVLCGYYFDTWFSWTQSDIEVFLRKTNSKLKIIVSNPLDERRLNEITRLFPQYNNALVSEKILQTKSKAEKIIQEQQLAREKLQFFLYKNLLNYSFILVDEKLLYITIYENERIEKADCFSILIDLSKNKSIKNFITKEIRLMIKNSEEK